MKARTFLLFIAMLAAAAGSRAAEADQAPVPVPNIAGQRAIVVDTLTDEVLFAKNPDSRALQGSIAKIMTLHVALDALEQGIVSLDDQVAISARAQSQACTCMMDVDNNGSSDLQVGQVFKLEDLLYAVSLSAGEATDAVAEHVATHTFAEFNHQPATTWQGSEKRMKRFVGLMNQHVAQLGLQKTTFVTVHGGDGCDFSISCDPDCDGFLAGCVPDANCDKGELCGGGTTARDLVAIWRHAAQDPLFLTITGFRSHGPVISYTWNPQAYYTYTFTKAFPYYPGVDGDKNGGSPGCGVCWLAQATRNGRTLVAVVMQSTSGQRAQADMTAMFNYGFARVFGPDRRDDSAALGPAIQDHALGCASDGGMAVSAIRTPAGQLAVIAWGVNENTGDIARMGSWSEAAGANTNVTDVDTVYVRNGSFVTAALLAPPERTPLAGSSVELVSWKLESGALPGTVKITRLADSGALAGAGAQVRLLRLADGLIVSAVRDGSGALTLKTWRVAWDGTFTLLDDSGGGAGAPAMKEFALAGGARPTAIGQPVMTYEVITAGRHWSTDNLRLYSWHVSASTGEITLRQWAVHVDARNISITRKGIGRYATASTDGAAAAGSLRVTYWDVAPDGAISRDGILPDTQMPVATETGIEGLGPAGENGLLTAIRDGSGNLKLTVWGQPEPFEGPLDERRIADSGGLAGAATQIETCRMPTAQSAGDYVTAVRTGGGTLKLITWRSGEK